MKLLLILLGCMCLLVPASAQGSRPLLDLVDVQGVRDNQLVGYGLVVGLPGSGDRNQVRFAAQSLNNMLRQFGVQLDENELPRSRNVAAVTVTATLPAMAGPGQQLDVTVTSLGDARSLHGGALMLTPLRGVDGAVYALAQGNLVVGGVTASGNTGSSVTVNVPTAGIIPNGAIVERAVLELGENQGEIILNLKSPNYQTARNIVNAVNDAFGPQIARAENWARLVLSAPADADSRNTFMSMLQDIHVDEGSSRPRVVFNSRTGTVVMNDLVRVKRAAVSHGNLTITISEQPGVVQPGPFSRGVTAIVPDSEVRIDQQQANMMVWPEGTSLDTIVQAINSLGATPSELMSILLALDSAGALDADLLVI